MTIKKGNSAEYGKGAAKIKKADPVRIDHLEEDDTG
jgi:hypothetical protein